MLDQHQIVSLRFGKHSYLTDQYKFQSEDTKAFIGKGNHLKYQSGTELKSHWMVTLY